MQRKQLENFTVSSLLFFGSWPLSNFWDSLFVRTLSAEFCLISNSGRGSPERLYWIGKRTLSWTGSTPSAMDGAHGISAMRKENLSASVPPGPKGLLVLVEKTSKSRNGFELTPEILGGNFRLKFASRFKTLRGLMRRLAKHLASPKDLSMLLLTMPGELLFLFMQLLRHQSLEFRHRMVFKARRELKGEFDRIGHRTVFPKIGFRSFNR